MRNSEHLANVMVQAFIDAVNEGIDLVPVVADSTSTAKIAPFIKQFPDRLVNVGIAEQSMVGTAAGLALDQLSNQASVGGDRKSTRLNSSHSSPSRMPSSA